MSQYEQELNEHWYGDEEREQVIMSPLDVILNFQSVIEKIDELALKLVHAKLEEHVFSLEDLEESSLEYFQFDGTYWDDRCRETIQHRLNLPVWALFEQDRYIAERKSEAQKAADEAEAKRMEAALASRLREEEKEKQLLADLKAKYENA